MTPRDELPSVPGSTEAHPLPAVVAPVRGRPALLTCFPRPAVVALDGDQVQLGRDFFSTRGQADSQISSRHCELSRRGTAWSVVDANSRNGTWIDGTRLAPGEKAALADGSVLRIGNTLLVYREAFEGTETPASPLGAMVGPFGLRGVADAIDTFRKWPPSAVLIEGETGTGKELAAAAIAAALGRGNRYGAVNVAAVAAGVFESHLFGHVAGAFSGSAKGGSPGFIAAHQGGAVFLDEIGELALDAQAKLLRLAEYKEILPVGATRPTVVDVLLVAATNRPLDEMVENGTFRRDLLARFMAARVELPSLRDRPEDLPAIAAGLLARKGLALDPRLVEIEAIERMALASWPSNIRELAAVLDRIAMIATPGALPLWALEKILGPAPSQPAASLTLERVQAALQRCGGNESLTSRELGITRGKLRRFLAASAR